MNLFGQAIGRMYVITILLLLALAIYSSYLLRQFPLALAFAVLIAGAAEVAINATYLKQKLKFPFSGVITGLIIGSVAPIGAPLLAILVACLVAILSKFFLKSKATNIFNPAALGLLAGLGVFAIGDQWWAASSVNLSGFAISIAIILAICTYEARRMVSAISFIIVAAIGYAILGNSITLSGMEVAVMGVNYFFALIMVADPKTSPHKNSAQVAFGSGVAILYSAFSFIGLSYAYFIALLAGNAVYALYKSRGRKLI